MPKQLLLKVEDDHIESLTRANGITAISELIWNSLDADASIIDIDYKRTTLGGYEEITIADNGHGLRYSDAIKDFETIGGSKKKEILKSPGGRYFHGKEGKGRYKALALGDLINIESYYKDNGHTKRFTIDLDRNQIKKPLISDEELFDESRPSSFKVSIFNINDKHAHEVFGKNNQKELQEKFASYHISYPNFKIFINSKELEFDSIIKNKFTAEDIRYETEGGVYSFKIEVIEWNFDNSKRTYFCNEIGIPYKEALLGIRSSLPISIFIKSAYIEKLHKQNLLAISELDSVLGAIFDDAKKIARKYVRERLHVYSRVFIEDLKREGIYPYTEQSNEEIEVAKRQVFDIVALNINEYLPSFSDQDKSGKKLTLSLVKEALEQDSSRLNKILSEVIGLPKDKREELSELLDKTSLVSVIDTMTEITTRLDFLNALELLIYDPEHSRKVLERKHLHKIIVNETWVFGDEYTYGADDITLKNVLKQYLKALGRDDFEEVVSSSDNSDLTTIPDVCLWKQYNAGKYENHINLVVELKKPTVDAGFDELNQIQSYAQKVSNDARFPKTNTRWLFILLVREVKDEIAPQLNQKNRDYGHVFDGDSIDVYVLKWGTVINKAKARYRYVREKLNLNFQQNEDALKLLRDKYKHYLPDLF